MSFRFRLVLVVALAALTAAAVPPRPAPAPPRVSLCAVLAHPAAFAGRRVVIASDIRIDLALTARCGAARRVLPIVFTTGGHILLPDQTPVTPDIAGNAGFRKTVTLLREVVPHAPVPASFGRCPDCYRKFCEVSAVFTGSILVVSRRQARRNQGFGIMRRSTVGIDLRDVRAVRGRVCTPAERHLPSGWPTAATRRRSRSSTTRDR